MADDENLEPIVKDFWKKPKKFTPSQLQIIGYRDVPAGMQGAAALGLGDLKMISSTGYQAMLSIDHLLPFDVAICEINKVVRKLGFESVKDDLIYNLLCRTLDDPLPVEVHARSILFVFNNIHKAAKLKVNYKKLMEHWGGEFQTELDKTVEARKLPNGEQKEPKLLIRGSAHALVLQQTRHFGGVSYRFTERDALRMLERNAGGRKEIAKEEFVKAVQQSVRKIITLEERINSPIMSPILFRRPLFPKGDIRELKL